MNIHFVLVSCKFMLKKDYDYAVKSLRRNCMCIKHANGVRSQFQLNWIDLLINKAVFIVSG